MQKFFAQRAGKDNKYTKNARVSAQKSQMGRSHWEKAQKNSTAPPTAPNTMKPRSSPPPRSMRKEKAAAPAVRQ